MLDPLHGTRPLDRAECLALMRTVPVGRLVYTDRALPAVVPVGFALDGDRVVVRSAAGSSLTTAVRGTVVAFHTDAYDVPGGTAWSVTATGLAAEATDPAEVERLSRLARSGWAQSTREAFLVVPTELLTGVRTAGRAALAG